MAIAARGRLARTATVEEVQELAEKELWLVDILPMSREQLQQHCAKLEELSRLVKQARAHAVRKLEEMDHA